MNQCLIKQQLTNVDFVSLVQNCQQKVDDLNQLKENNAPTFTSIISFDNVSCFYYPYWPEISEEWLKRERKWPSEDVVKKIADKGCYIVPKQSRPDEIHRLEWRYSFSLAEIKLALNRTPKTEHRK